VKKNPNANGADGDDELAAMLAAIETGDKDAGKADAPGDGAMSAAALKRLRKKEKVRARARRLADSRAHRLRTLTD
jgi:hypothetical protein